MALSLRWASPHQHAVHDDQRDRAQQPADEAVVVADHRVLHDVRQEQQHHQVERVELRQVPLPRQAEQQEDAEVHRDGADHLLGERDAGGEQVVGDGREHRCDGHAGQPAHRLTHRQIGSGPVATTNHRVLLARRPEGLVHGGRLHARRPADPRARGRRDPHPHRVARHRRHRADLALQGRGLHRAGGDRRRRAGQRHRPGAAIEERQGARGLARRDAHGLAGVRRRRRRPDAHHAPCRGERPARRSRRVRLQWHDRLRRACSRSARSRRATRSWSRPPPAPPARSPCRSPSCTAAASSASPAPTRSAAGWSTTSASTAPSTTSTDDIPTKLRELCPKRVDVFFDNTGGPILDAVLGRLADRGPRGAVRRHLVVQRPPQAARAAELPQPHLPPGPHGGLHLVGLVGPLGRDHRHPRRVDRRREARHTAPTSSRASTSAPQALNAMFTGENIGKIVIRVGAEK